MTSVRRGLPASLLLAAAFLTTSFATGATTADYAAASESATALKAAWVAKDAKGFTKLSLSMVLTGRDEDTLGLLERLKATVAVAKAKGIDGLEGPLLSMSGEAWARGVPKDTLASILLPIKGKVGAVAKKGEPNWVPVASTRGFGARFLRVDIARAGLTDVLADPTGSLESHFGDALCDQTNDALKARYGSKVAAEIRALCDAGSLYTEGGGELGGGLVSALSDFDCLLEEAGDGQPAFDEQVTQATIDCMDSMMGGGNPLASGSGQDGSWIKREWERHNQDGSITYGIEDNDGNWSERTEYPNGCKTQVVVREDGSHTIINWDTDENSRSTTFDDQMNVVRDEADPDYDPSKCEACDTPLAGEPIDDGTVVADGGEFGPTDECLELDLMLYEHGGKIIPKLGEDRPRDWVSYPSPDADPAVDANDCLSLAISWDVTKSPATCGLQLCGLGSIADPDKSCTCQPAHVFLDMDALSADECAKTWTCENGVPTAVNGVCACPQDEPSESFPIGGGPTPPVDDGWHWF